MAPTKTCFYCLKKKKLHRFAAGDENCDDCRLQINIEASQKSGRQPCFGYRFFECDDCGTKWKEKCRDAQTPSQSYCPKINDDDHPTNYGQGVSPCGWEFHPEWPKDKYGEIAIEPGHKYGEVEIWDGKFGDEDGTV